MDLHHYHLEFTYKINAEQSYRERRLHRKRERLLSSIWKTAEKTAKTTYGRVRPHLGARRLLQVSHVGARHKHLVHPWLLFHMY